MLIGELAKKSGLSRDTIRYYETRGLLPSPIRRDNQYKEYCEDAVSRLAFIRDMQELGFTLKEASQFIELSETGNATCQNTGPLIQAHLHSIDTKIDKLIEMRERINQSFTACEGNALTDSCTPIAEPLREC